MRGMCGRIVCYSKLEDISAALDATLDPSAKIAYQPSYNIPPSQPIPIVCQFERDRRLLLAKWGLLPHWAKDESLAFKTFNARAETVREKPSFRGAFKYRRCLVPMNGYYEWRRQGSTKPPYYFSRAHSSSINSSQAGASPINASAASDSAKHESGAPDSILTLAGLFEIWKEELVTCTVITTEANEMAREVHHRMPVVLEGEDRQIWLDASPDDAYNVLKPASDGVLSKYQVNRAVNNVKNNSSDLIVRVNTSTSS